jgi:Ca2+-transporting ATPase
MHIVAALEAREPGGTIFALYTVSNRRFIYLIGAAILLTFFVTALGPLQRIFDTTALTTRQWGVCLLAPLAFLLIVEAGKLFTRRSQRREPAPAPEPSVA